MTKHRRRTFAARAAAALLAGPLLLSSAVTFDAALGARAKNPAAAAAPPAAAQSRQLPPRIPFTAAEDENAAIPGMPDARFWADSLTGFTAALPPQPGPWLILSTGGSDGAFGAGLLAGLSAAGNRPDYAVVTGVSTGALMAPFAFLGGRYDDALRDVYTKTTAADIFEVGSTGESFVDTWPLKDLIAKKITPDVLAAIAAEYRRGRRLFVVTTDLDAQRGVVWNMGAIAAHAADKSGGDAALNLFRSVLLASGSVPGAFPPVLINVESGGKHFQEMHVDGGVSGQFFVAPPASTASNSAYRIPATQLYIVVNSSLARDFEVVDRSTPAILAQSVSTAIKADLRALIDRTYVAAKNSGVGFNVAAIPADFSAPSRGPFDPDYMRALYQLGFEQGKGANAFAGVPPPYPGEPALDPPAPNLSASPVKPTDNEQPGATR
jgi:predicted patatin/cPLA2 family phospholipase